MPNLATLIIDDVTGDVTFLVTPAAAAFVTPDAVVSRASHVEPDNFLLRILFHALRTVLGDKGRMSDFTRRWPCLWRVNTAPTAGVILPNRYTNRQAAIDAEVEFLNKFLSGEKI
jgi:hypothetical protein